MNNCSVPPSDTKDLRHGMYNDVSQVLNTNVSSSYSQSDVSTQEILVELDMCESTTTKYRKLIFVPTLLFTTLLVITYSVLAYHTVIATPQVYRKWKTAL